MSFFTSISSAALLASPSMQATREIAGAAVMPLIGLCAVIVVGIIFKPLLRGIFRAGLLMINPRKSLERRIADNKIAGRKIARRMANDQAGSQPSLAAELRLLASSN
ncbi:hypothetical protein [Glaciimonas sp. PAMC28666]|uniref:hypothetical protein n=1 Tax=Glaciimonas sp. PAMC28666 TaxID=2807626 RepID=UPI0019648B2A|nr:hypothetical protein [Glaciimonas sp. PAMC28666]QRX84242.1 hypothetical protein JQN73_08690 [Glaciimonas sp. PAMC28666]